MPAEDHFGRDVFAPGFGCEPKVIVGRDAELADFAWRLGILARGAAGKHIVLIGPRGNGKTVLCRRLERMAEEAGAKVLAISGADASSSEALARALSRPRAGQRIGVRGANVRALRARNGLSAGPREEALVADALARLARSAGAVLTLDEAHVADPA